MPAYDFFARQELVRPTVTPDDAERIASELFGITGTASELGSNQDRNFRIDAPVHGEAASYLLKVDNSAFSEPELAAQDAAMPYLAERGLRVPVPVAGLDGQTRQLWQNGGTSLTVRMLTFLDGVPLAGEPDFTPATVAELGRLSGLVARELADFHSDGLDRRLQWDLRSAGKVVDLLIDSVPDAAKRELVLAKTGEALERLNRVAAGLRVQPIHGDITDDNVLGRPVGGALVPEAVIDFGDLANSWLVAELAVTVSSVLHHVRDATDALAAVEAFAEVVPLTDDEVAALWPLVVLRGAVLVVSGEYQLGLEQDNEYAAERTDHEWTIFTTAAGVDWDQAEDGIRALIAESAAPAAEASPAVHTPRTGPPADVGESVQPAAAFLPVLAEGDYEVLDFSVTSPALNEGRWLHEDAEWTMALDVLERAQAAVAPFGQCRLTRARPNLRDETATLSLGTELFLAAGTAVHAPVDAEITAIEPHQVGIAFGRYELLIAGLEPTVEPGTVSAGTVLGLAADARDGQGRLFVQLITGGASGMPHFTTPSQQAASVLDPARLLGIEPVAQQFGADRELERRSRIFASAQERYYLNPPQIERGWKEFLIGVDGRVYLDMVNNVAAIGHSHPRQVTAVTDQLALLNTNSRFLYRALADLSERLVELAPDPSLDTVLLVNSGTEAVDLALRLAQVYTDRKPIVALREAYHGWSMGADAITTSAFDNPFALANRPDWVEIADVPNPYRGTYRGEDSAESYLADLRGQLDAMADAGRHPAGFICEPVLGNAGGVLMPDGYLAGAYDEIRRRGGVCIADEVQVGYGRLGRHLWGVQQQGVVPDIITIAKAMGNGYPLGAVITRKEIAEALSREGNFFSSSGGSPVSCAAGLAVLDVIRDEELQANAATVGEHLVGRLQELADRHPVIGAVHGMGLYLGIELVRSRETLEPATVETEAVCERLLQLGVIMQATSERQNVLKVKPPLCLSMQSADFFVDALDEVLTNG